MTLSKTIAAVAVIGLFGLAAGCKQSSTSADGKSVRLLNVSYDPTRELWRDLNKLFIKQYQAETGITVEIKQSHGGSASQARAIIDGLKADVATLGMWLDTEMLAKSGLVDADWMKRLPHNSLPYYSTIVFVVRKGNPKGIKDWPDLVKSDVKIVTPNPKTGGNGKLSFLAAWGAILANGGTEADAQQFITQLYGRVPVLDNGARASTSTFAQKGIGDVHLTWENEAYLEIKEAKEKLEIVYPKRSIRAEPHITVVDKIAKANGTEEVAKKYLEFAYTEAGQEVIAKHHYRPIDEAVFKKHAAEFPQIELFGINTIGKDWEAAHLKFFVDGGVFDKIYAK